MLSRIIKQLNAIFLCYYVMDLSLYNLKDYYFNRRFYRANQRFSEFL